MAVHEGKDRFRCRDYPPCSETFRKHQTLQRHVRTEHLKTAAFPCKEGGCGEGFPTAAALRRHTERDHGEPNFWCDECGSNEDEKEAAGPKMGFSTLALLQAHMRNEHRNCMFCEFKCKGQYELNHHIEIRHSTVSVEERKTIFCTWDGCQKKFTKKSNLEVHIRSAHEGKRFICGQVDVSKAVDLEEWPNDDGCGNGFVTKGNLEDHIRFVHMGFERPKAPKVEKPRDILKELSGLMDAEKRSIACTIEGCVYKFIRHHDLQVHLQNHPHDDDRENDSNENPVHETVGLSLVPEQLPNSIDLDFLLLNDPASLDPQLPLAGQNKVNMNNSTTAEQKLGPESALNPWFQQPGDASPSELLFTVEGQSNTHGSTAYNQDQLWVGGGSNYVLGQAENEWARQEAEMASLMEEYVYSYPSPEMT
jgi:uncharacterized Zn-finger protein